MAREEDRRRGAVERERAMKVRAVEKSVVRKRTVKGQPLLNQRIKGLLGKIEKMVGGGGGGGGKGGGGH